MTPSTHADGERFPGVLNYAVGDDGAVATIASVAAAVFRRHVTTGETLQADPGSVTDCLSSSSSETSKGTRDDTAGPPILIKES